MGIVFHTGGNVRRLFRREAGFAFLAADVDFQQNILHDALLCRFLFDAGQQLQAIHRLNQIHFAHHLPNLIGLQMSDKMDGFSLIGTVGQLCRQLLHTVFAAAVHAGGNRLTHPLGIVHLCCRAEQNLSGVTPCLLSGRVHFRADRSNVFCNHEPITFPSVISSAVMIISSFGQRCSVSLLSQATR